MSQPLSERAFRKYLPKALVLLRQSRGFTQQDLAERVGIQQPVLCRYETQASTPTSARLAKVLHTLVASWTDLDLALTEVQRAEEHGEVPSEKAVLDRPDTLKEDLMIAFMKANQEGRGEQFMNELIELTRYMGRLQWRMNVKKVFGENENGEPEAGDEANDPEDSRNAQNDGDDEGDEG